MSELQLQFASPKYKSIDQPFFSQDSNMNNLQVKEEVNNITSKLHLLKPRLHKTIEDFFISNQTLQEIYINNWTIMNLDSIIERHNICKKDRIYVYDIGFRYEGMGHIKMAFYDPKLEKIFYRIDGGANGYDRIDNYKKLKTYNSEINIENGLSFQDFLNEAREYKEETTVIF
jgi:hypothetical protein